MSDASNRAERYRELAEGCRRLAAIAFSTETRGGMLCGATQYGIKLLVDALTRARDGADRAWRAFGLVVALIAANSGLVALGRPGCTLRVSRCYWRPAERHIPLSHRPCAGILCGASGRSSTTD